MTSLSRLHAAWALAFSFFFAATAMANEAPPPEAITGTTKVSAAQVVELVEKLGDKLVIVDSRKKEDRAATGWVPGSIGLPDYETTPATLAKVIPTKDTAVVFYCNGVKCGRSVKTATMAVQEGYTKVYWFRDGWDGWAKDGLPVEK